MRKSECKVIFEKLVRYAEANGIKVVNSPAVLLAACCPRYKEIELDVLELLREYGGDMGYLNLVATLAHEIGHCLCDHDVLPGSAERHIEKEKEAWLVGIELVKALGGKITRCFIEIMVNAIDTYRLHYSMSPMVTTDFDNIKTSFSFAKEKGKKI